MLQQNICIKIAETILRMSTGYQSKHHYITLPLIDCARAKDYP